MSFQSIPTVESKYLTQAVTGAMDIMRSTPMTLESFVNEVLESFMSLEPGEFVPLGEMHQQWTAGFRENTHTAIICARGHLKTSWGLSVLAYLMLRQPNFRALYISATLEQAWDKLEQFEEICRRSWRLEG